MNPDDIEGEEAGDERVDAEEEIKFTPFNMKEELEEGHFDQSGHYHFKKDERHLDNWLDDVDWVKIKKDENYRKKYYTAEGEYSSSDDDNKLAAPAKFDSLASFSEILAFMQPSESINKTLQRLNKKKMNVSTAQRWKMKKEGIVDEASENITKITGIVNEILTKTGNMNVYELTYEQIKLKVNGNKSEAGSSKQMELDMYADDFDEKEKNVLTETSVTFAKPAAPEEDEAAEAPLMWEFKLSQAEDSAIQGPFTTEQMSKKAENGDFKNHVFVRKVGDERFYSSARVDFDLYL